VKSRQDVTASFPKPYNFDRLGRPVVTAYALVRFLLGTAKHIFASIMAKAKKYGVRLLNLVVNLFVLTVCLIVIALMLFVAV
jgi:hypothetical protein